MKRFKMPALKLNSLSKSAIIAFLLSLTLCLLMITITIYNRVHLERLQMEQIIMDKSVKITEVISKLLYKTEALSALVIQGGGVIDSFDRVAAMVVDDPAIMNVLIAPKGVVSHVYPLQGNEAVLGLDFFSDGEGNSEAVMAVKTGKLVFGGPFNLVQGGQALVGRLPVYLDTPGHNREFWGIVSVTLKYPDALNGAGLGILEKQGYAYEIWRYNPDNGQQQLIAASSSASNPGAHFIEKQISILNADWYFRVSPVRQWYQYTENWILIAAALLVSFMVGFVMQNNYNLKIVKAEIEVMAQTDALTEIYNRRYFMDKAQAEIKRLRAENKTCHITILDIDHFKNLNDVYGHFVGDMVLRGFAERIDKAVRPDGLFARYGGEEFILLTKGMSDDEVKEFVENLRLIIYKDPFEIDGISIYISASFGISVVMPGDDFEDPLKKADGALYMAKGQGRNRVVVYDLPDGSECPEDRE